MMLQVIDTSQKSGKQRSLILPGIAARSSSLESLKKKAYKFADRRKANGEKD
jgi:hypothetical protein